MLNKLPIYIVVEVQHYNIHIIQASGIHIVIFDDINHNYQSQNSNNKDKSKQSRPMTAHTGELWEN